MTLNFFRKNLKKLLIYDEFCVNIIIGKYIQNTRVLMKKVKIPVLYLFVLCFLVSCSQSIGSGRNTGILADDKAVSSIKQEIEDKENSLLAAEGDVFWTPSGSLWHETYECGYLKNSKTIYHGTVEEARIEGKKGSCERCSKSDGSDIYARLEKNEIQSGDVFFTRDGEAWHSDINCQVIIGADKIYYSSKEIAGSLGKSDSCEECGNK